jgi:hypothetical protein
MTGSDPIEREKTTRLANEFMEVVAAHYQRGPRGPARVLEVLNAQAFVIATVLGGTADRHGKPFSTDAEAFFAEALRDILGDMKKRAQQ